MGPPLAGSPKWDSEKSAPEANRLRSVPRRPGLEAAQEAKRSRPARVVVPAIEANWGVAASRKLPAFPIGSTG